MLVLNTNEQWWEVLSNSMLDWENDYSSSILIQWTWDNTSTPTWWLLIGWMTINQFSETLSKQRETQGSLWTSSNIWSVFRVRTTYWRWQAWTTTTVSVASFWTIPAWKTIWKKIRVRYMPYRQNNSSWWEWSWWNITITIKVALLHTDWTNTIVWTYTREINWKTHNELLNIFNPVISNYIDEIISTPWFISQEWDRIWVEYKIVKTAWASSMSNSFWLDFWYLWALSFNEQPKPIQVSIE